MIYTKTAFAAFLALADTATVDAVLRGNRIPVDPTEELHMMMMKTRILKGTGGDTNKSNKINQVPPSENPTDPETTPPTASPTSQPTLLPTAKPSAAPTVFDSTISVACKPDGATDLTMEERSAKTIICNSAKPSCREAVTAVKESEQLQNFFGCAGDLGEGAARKLFNKYASSDILSGQLALVATTKPVLVTERPDEMSTACTDIAAMQSPAVADPCCQGSSGCTSVTGSASNSPPFMTIAITACTGDSACKDMGPNPLILDSSCTGASACELVNENEINPSITGVTFVGEMACTTPQSCEGVGRRSHGDVTIQTGACIGTDACKAAGRRVVQKALSNNRSHIDIGENACVGSNACKDAHSTVNYGTGGKRVGSLTIGSGGCAANGSCEKMGFNDKMTTDLVVPPGGCGSVKGCRGCMTKTECDSDEVYIMSDVDGACPKGGNDTNNNPTGDKVDEYCIGKDTLPTDSPTFFPTPFPTPATSPPTSSPTAPTASPTSAPTSAPTSPPTASSAPTAPTSAPTSAPTPLTFLVALGTPGTSTGLSLLSTIQNEADLLGIFENQATIDDGVALFDTISGKSGVLQIFSAAAAAAGEMFTGTAPEAIDWCGMAGRTCCVGTEACSWIGIASIASNSCIGDKVCKSIETQSMIFQGSCLSGTSSGTDACSYFNFNSGSDKASIIGPGSCTGNQACHSFAQQSDGYAIIGAGSCAAARACLGMGAGPEDYANLTPTQDTGGDKNKRVSTTVVGTGSCVNDRSCTKINSYFNDGVKSFNQFGGDTIVGDTTCTPQNSCYYVGFGSNFNANLILFSFACNDTPVTDGMKCNKCQYGGTSSSTCTPLGAKFEIAFGSYCPASCK